MKPIYFSGLNGLRAIAALGVLFTHITQGMYLFGLNPHIFGNEHGGNIAIHRIALYCVSIFFGISGFLITYLLLQEKKIGEINIKKFYMRRILRIWPLYYLYLILSIISLFILKIDFDKQQLFFYIFLMANIPFLLGKAIPFITHYWSLGVEEQFYLFWPNFIKRTKHILLASTALFVVIMLFKLIFYFTASKYAYSSTMYFFIDSSRFQCMLIGAISAILYFDKYKLFISIATHLITQIFSWCIIVLMFVNKYKFSYFISHELMTFVTCMIIISQIEQKNRIINLEHKIFDFFGKISYGIYVIHPLVAIWISKIVVFKSNNVINYIVIYILCISLTVILSYISYEFFEKRFLRIKNKYTTIESKSTM